MDRLGVIAANLMTIGRKVAQEPDHWKGAMGNHRECARFPRFAPKN